MMKDLAKLRKEIAKSIKGVDDEYYRLIKDSTDYTIEAEDNPFFKNHHIYLVTIWDVSIEMAFYVGQNKESGQILLLTENLEGLNAVVQEENLSIGMENAVEYVELVIKLTRPNYKHVYLVSDFADIPYRGYLPDEVEAQREKAREYLADKLHPPEVVLSNDLVRVELFVLEANTLEKRVYSLSKRGTVAVQRQTVLDEVGYGY